MIKNDDKSEKSENTHPNTTGSVVPEDEDFSRWIIRLWAHGEVLERIEVYQTFGRNRNNRGERIFHQDFKPNEKLTNEQCVKLSNEILAECQHDCDSLPPTQVLRGATYQLAVVNSNRRSEPLVRRIGPLQPKRSYIVRANDGEDLDDDDETPRDAKALELKYIQESLEQVRWDKRRYDGVMGEMLLLYHNTVEQLRGQNDKLLDKVMLFFDKAQEAQDRSLDRELIREKEKFKLSMYRDGLRTAQNMLPRLFAGIESHKKEVNGNGNGNGTSGPPNGTNGKGNDAPSAKISPEDAYGPSPERTLIGNFLHDCEAEGGEALMLKLFGEFEERVDGTAVLIKPGIFTFEQYAILHNVSEGRISPDAVDPLMPNSGHALSIKQEQIIKAMEAGVTQGIGSAIIELVGLRDSKKNGDDVEFTEAPETETPETSPETD